MKCRDVDSLLPLFFDGELDARRMRDVALHTARCVECESELRELETIQAHFQSGVEATLAEVDLDSLWPAVERRLSRQPPSLWQRLRAQWEGLAPLELPVALPAGALAAVAAFGAWLMFAQVEPSGAPELDRIAATDYANSLERLDTVFESVALVSDPNTQTMLLWIGDEALGVEP